MKKIFSILAVIVLAVIVGMACKQSKIPDSELEKEKEAIKAVIAKETESYYKQDFENWKDTYVDQPYFRSYGYWEGYPERVRYYNGFDTLEAFKKKQFEQNKTLWKGSREERRNENFRIYPGMAWYTFEQISYSADGAKILGRSVETRILEKQEGKWKIAYLGFHYLPDTLGFN
jgi:hypothetical protein